jgi:hypothetical protein
MMINVPAIKGEKHTGFEKEGRLGEFECGNCHYYRQLSPTHGSCGQADMMEYSQEPMMADGRILVGAEDCCEFVDRVGRSDLDVFPELK